MTRMNFRIFIILFLAIAGCQERPASFDELANDKADSIISIQFPIRIEGGSRIVYRFTKMTPRGLKYFYDTVDAKNLRLDLPDSVRVTFLSPINLSSNERENSPAIIAISIPGMWEETVFGFIDDKHVLHLNYTSEMELTPITEINFQPGDWSSRFQNNEVEVTISASLADTPVGDHLAGKGKLILTDNGKLTEEHEIFLVCDKTKR